MIAKPLNVKFLQDDKGNLIFVDAEGMYHENVHPVKLFPMTAVDHWVSVLSYDGEEITCIEDPKLLPEDSYRVLCDVLIRHHFVPIIGKTHIAYVPNKKVLGLSKLNRIVDYFAKRPQIQERLTLQIHQALCTILETQNVAVVVDAMHACVKTRGIKDVTSMTRTSKLAGVFKEDTSHRHEFMNTIPRAQEVIY